MWFCNFLWLFKITSRKLYLLIGSLGILYFSSLVIVRICMNDDNYLHRRCRLPHKIFKFLGSTNHEQDANLIGKKIIYGATDIYGTWEERFSFTNCPHNNCVVKSGSALNIDDADIVLFGYEFIRGYPPAVSENRYKQIWILKAHESPQGLGGSYKLSEDVNGYFNATYTYRSDSELYSPYGAMSRRQNTNNSKRNNYAKGKTKGAFAYVSNCDTSNYDRVGFMMELKKYIDVDIFGKCTDNSPCPRMDYACENKMHSQYRFYLSYENSLCKDYITEKFWSHLQSPAIFLPVALGGMTTSEYESVAPPDSFLHYYNFSSTERLGKYLQYLMKNDTAYNRYHTWRSHYDISDGADVSCAVCEMANNRRALPVKEHLDKWFNNPALCRTVNL